MWRRSAIERLGAIGRQHRILYTSANSGAVAAVNALTADNLFDGQPPRFFRKLMRLAEEADEARREVGFR